MSLSRLDVLRGLKISIWEGVWATIWMVLTTGAFQIGFAQGELGATPFALGLMAGLPAVVNLLQIPASLYVEKRGERKNFVAFTSFTGRLLWIPILLIPFVVPAPIRLPVFLVLLTLSSALLALCVPAWTSWMSGLVPPSSRGEYFARRNQLAGLVAMLIPLPAGAFLDLATKYQRFEPRIGFAVLFGLACLAAVGAFVLIRRQPEPPMPPTPPTSENPLRSIATPFTDSDFRPFILFAAATVFGQGFAGQFFMAWQVGAEGLNQPYLVVQILGLVATAGGLFTTPFWGYLSDKFGPRPVLMISSGGTILAPLLWVFTTPQNFWFNIILITVINVASGVSWAGVGLAQFNLLLGLAPTAKQSTYVAVFSALTGILGGIAPVLGGGLMTLLASLHWNLGALDINNFKLLFLITVLIRIGCVFLLTQVPRGESQSTREMLQQVLSARPLTSYYTVRRLSQPATEDDRRKTIEEITQLRSPLAVDELTRALDDVSPQVRERAVEALATIGSPRAIPALGAKLSDPSAGLGEKSAEALGEIGDPEATPYLIRATQGPDATVRLAAIKALARVVNPTEHPDAIQTLIALLDPVHPTRTEASCATLATLAATLTVSQRHNALPLLLALLTPETHRGMRFAAARTVRSFTPFLQDSSVAHAVFASVRKPFLVESDPAVLAEEASALAQLGTVAGVKITDLLELLLPVLDRTAGATLAYKQSLAAIADSVLPTGTFYPYLGLSENARDTASSRLFSEMREGVRKQKGKPSAELSQTLSDALEAFTERHWEQFHRRMSSLHSLLSNEDSTQTYLLQQLLHRAEQREATWEESLLALLLYREQFSLPLPKPM